MLMKHVTGDETWIHYYASKIKEQSKELTSFNGKTARKGKKIISSCIMLLQPHFSVEKVFFHHNNAPAHSCATVATKLVELEYKLLPHSPLSPDLVRSNFFFFQIEKISLAERDFLQILKS